MPRISALPAGAALADGDLLCFVDDSEAVAADKTKKITALEAKTYFHTRGTPDFDRLTLTGGAMTSDLKLLDGSVTWNNAGVTFTALRCSVTNTASGASSRLALFELAALGADPKTGLQLSNPTAAAAGAQQYSPALRLTGQGWKTNATAASQAVDFRLYNLPVQGSASPSAILMLDFAVNGGAFTNYFQFSSAGSLTLLAGGGSVQLGASGQIIFGARSRIASSADGAIEFYNTAQNGFTRLCFGGLSGLFPALKRSNSDLHVRLADDTDYSNLVVNQLIAQNIIYATGNQIVFSGGEAITSTGAGNMAIENADLNLNTNALLRAGVQVVDTRKTGWTAATGTATRTTFATGTVTLAQLAERVKALLDDLISHGLIGA